MIGNGKGFTKETLIGIFWAAVSVVFWGSMFPVVSFLMKRGNVNAFTLAQVRFLIAGSVMLLFYGFIKHKNVLEKINTADWFVLVLEGALCAAMSVLLFCAQDLGIPVVNASLLESESPLLIFVLGLLILKMETSVLQTVGLILGFIGSLFVLKVICATGLELQSLATGDLLIFISAVTWAFYTIFARSRIRKMGGFLFTAWSALFAGILIFLFQLITGDELRYPTLVPDVLWTLFIGLCPTAIAFFAWNNAQRYISVGLLAISGYITPMLAALLGVIVFHENLTWFQIIGMIIVCGAVLIEPEISDGLSTALKNRKSLKGKSDI